MAKLKVLTGGKRKDKSFSLVYGLRLYPATTVSQVFDGTVALRDETNGQVPLQVFAGTREQLRARLLAEFDALFDIHSDDMGKMARPPRLQGEEVSETGC